MWTVAKISKHEIDLESIRESLQEMKSLGQSKQDIQNDKETRKIQHYGEKYAVHEPLKM
jgi:hypothetical protein